MFTIMRSILTVEQSQWNSDDTKIINLKTIQAFIPILSDKYINDIPAKVKENIEVNR